MDHSFDFRGLFVLDLANNHQGCLNHGLRIVRESGAVVASRGVRAALKFQLRELDTYVHPAHRAGSPNRHVARFLGTALGRSDFATLARAVRDAGLATMATPFDEGSLDVIEELDVQLIKIASASATDWPLLERVATQNRPVIVSTGGLSFEAIDDLVSFFDHRRVHFALMHCVSIYPTPFEHLQLNQIEVLRRRYPDRVIGFSTHETPEALEPVMIAVAKGAEILERHVGIATDTIKLNAYSSTPAQLEAWIEAAQRARTLCGDTRRAPASAEEVASLVDLQRGVYARRPLCAGEQLKRSDVYFAMPLVNGGLRSGQWREGTVVRTDIAEHAALSADTVALPPPHPKATLFQALHTAKAMLNEARIALPTDFELEFSHHYGVERFPEVGAILIDCINREYCKKIIVQLPGQRHPMHYHRRKDETFHVLAGIMEAEVEGRRRTLVAGDLLVVPQGVWHSFWNTTGLIFEEISSTHHNDDAFYEDKRINAMARDERKSRVSQWGRFQL